jgi:hypothetical protein
MNRIPEESRAAGRLEGCGTLGRLSRTQTRRARGAARARPQPRRAVTVARAASASSQMSAAGVTKS